MPALVTHRWIEEPLRRSKMHLRRPRAILVAAIAGPAAAVLSGVALSAGVASPPALTADRAEGAGQLARTGRIQESATALRPRPVDAEADRGKPYRDGCLVEERGTRSPRCVYGARRPRATVVLFGDSHAMQLFPALEQVALRRGWRLVNLTKAGCPPSTASVVSPLSRRRYPECDAWRESALAPDRARGAARARAGGRLRRPPRARGHRAPRGRRQPARARGRLAAGARAGCAPRRTMSSS